MGYTHYWEYQGTNPLPDLTPARSEVARFVRYAQRCGYKLANHCEVQTKPVLTEHEISFNGKGDDHHEDMYIQDASGYHWCKTNRNEYDDVVVATLLIMKTHLGNKLRIDSDGFQMTEYKYFEISNGVYLWLKWLVKDGQAEGFKIKDITDHNNPAVRALITRVVTWLCKDNEHNPKGLVPTEMIELAVKDYLKYIS